MKPPHRQRPGHQHGGRTQQGGPPRHGNDRPQDRQPDAPRGGSDVPRGGPRTLHAKPSPRPDSQRPDSQRPDFQRPDFPRSEHRRGDRRPEHRPDPARGDARGGLWLYGLHAVAAALANPSRRLRRLVLTEEAEAAIAQRLPPPWPTQGERMDRDRLDKLLGREAVHQGAALLVDPLVPPPLAAVLERPGPVLVLDHVTDPRNVGAILRAAAAFAAAGVIVQDRNAPEETGAMARAASGALETVPLLRAVNIARTLVALKAADRWVVGLDAGAKPLSGPGLAERRVALVLGSEGEGMRRLTRDTCDELAGIAMPGGSRALDSLNVAAATAVALYELGRR